MQLVSLHDAALIEAYLMQDPGLHIYELGDLAPAFWPGTVWYGLVEQGQIQALALLYMGLADPIILALDHSPAMRVLIQCLTS